MRIDIYSDTVCPWCYLGKRRFDLAVAARPQFEPRVTWRPFELNPDMPARLAANHPDTLIVLNHAGMPVDRDEAGLATWRGGVKRLAAEPRPYEPEGAP